MTDWNPLIIAVAGAITTITVGYNTYLTAKARNESNRDTATIKQQAASIEQKVNVVAAKQDVAAVKQDAAASALEGDGK